MPNLNRKGKIQLEELCKISLCSSGSGGFLKGLHKQGLMKILKKTQVDYLNIFNTNNVNLSLVDPFVIGLMTTSKNDNEETNGKEIEVITEVFKKETTKIEYPIILQNSEGGVEMLYPEETLKAMKIDGALFPKYESLDLNFFTTTKFLAKLLDKKGPELFKYRLKKKKDLKTYRTSVRESFVEGGMSYYSFELNVFNISKLSKNVKLILRGKEDVIMMKNEPGAPNFTEKEAIEKIKELATDHCRAHYGDEISKFYVN